MCGIFGYQIFKDSNIEPRLLTESLIKLSEKRGYDASGICCNSGENYLVLKKPQPGTDLIKSKLFKELFNKKQLGNSKTITLIGQCRLQTDGSKYIQENNQPIINDKIALVHNGIIENHKVLNSTNDESTEILSDYNKSDTLNLARYINNNIDKKNISELFYFLKATVKGSYSVGYINKADDTLSVSTNTGSLYYIRSDSLFIFSSERNFMLKIKKKFNLNNNYVVHKLYPGKFLNINLDKPLNNKKKNSSNFYNFGGETKKLRRCSVCILPETYPYIKFNDKGVCNFCISYLKNPKKIFQDKLNYIFDKYRSKNNEPDCLVGLSGGRDSCYGLHILKKEFGMNPIAYTYDWGLTSEVSRINQAKITGALGIEHIIRSPNIQKKRDYIRLNVNAWLKKPKLGMVPIFMAGDKDFYQYGRILRKENNIKLTVFASGQVYEQRNFFIGFCGVEEFLENTSRLYDYPLKVKFQLAFYYALQYILNPRYINLSLLDTLKSFFTSFVLKDDFIYLFEYTKWDEKKIISTLQKEYGWLSDTNYGKNQWRMGDGQTAFTNYIFYKLAGFTEFDNFRSIQIRDELLTRKEALDLIQEDNKPKFKKIKEFCETVGLSSEKVLTQIELIEPIF